MGDVLGPNVYFPPFVSPSLPPLYREHVMCKSWERRNCQESRVSKKAAVSSVKRRRLTWKRDQTLTLRLALQRLLKLKLQRRRDAYFNVFINSGGSEDNIRRRGLGGCDEDPPDVRALITSHQRLCWRWSGAGGRDGGRGTLKVTGDTPTSANSRPTSL